MTRMFTRMIAAMLFLVSAASAAAQSSEEAIEPDRQILVLLRQAPAHYRSDSAYDGSYGGGMDRAARERLGRKIAHEHNILFVGSWPMPVVGLDCLIMAAPDAQSAAAVAAEIALDADVEWAEPVQLYAVKGGPAGYNDPLFAAAPAARQWHLAQLHQMATGRRMTIAVIDTRVDSRHPDLAGQIATSQEFVNGRPGGAERHGTEVAGVIAAKANNGVGMVGVAPNARLMALRACWQLPGSLGSACDSLSLAKALHFAIEHGAQIVNMSLSGPRDRLLGRLIDVGLARGVTIVASADRGDAAGGFPASHGGVIAVSDLPNAAAPQGVVGAPGSGIPTTQPGAKWYLVSGSSYAAAHVSGLVALMRERRQARGSALPALVAMPGAGRFVDARATLSQATKSCDKTCQRTRTARRPAN
jgi:subtilisin family serine protease